MSVILIAEDEEPLLETLVEVARAMGHLVLAAIDGDEALRLARSHHLDLIVSDYMMPRRSGIELLHALECEPRLSRIPFVLMSAASPREREEATRFLAKPITLADFENTIRELIASGAAGARPAASVTTGSSRASRGPASAVEREDMVAWVAHELKNPLSTLRMLSGLLSRDAQDAEQQRRLGQMTAQLERMTELVSSLLDAAVLSSGRVSLHREPHDLKQLVEEILASWRAAHPEIELESSLPEEPVFASIDRARVRQVIDNLLSNAVKYGVPARYVHVQLSHSPGWASIQVSDRGPGISPVELPHIFERFYRASEIGGGHGLGLFIAAELTRLHEGTLSARSTLGKGATFELCLPRVDRALH